MPISYSLAASAAADISAIASALVFIFPRPNRLQLPTSEAHQSNERFETEDRKDPFDIASREDIIDGYPLDEDKFWSQVCFWVLKLFC
jgi:hypothetical protein